VTHVRHILLLPKTEYLQQRYCIKFCQKLGNTQEETICNIQQPFGLGVTQIEKWFNRFKDGRLLVDSDQHSGRPSTSQNADVIDKVRTLMMEDRCLTVREIADEVGISRGSTNTALTEDLWMPSVVAKYI
jgi:transposase